MFGPVPEKGQLHHPDSRLKQASQHRIPPIATTFD